MHASSHTTAAPAAERAVASSRPLAEARRGPDGIALVAVAGKRSANGGINSLYELVRQLREPSLYLLTAHEDSIWARWRQAGIPVVPLLEGRNAAAGTTPAAPSRAGGWRWQAAFAWQLRAAFRRSRPSLVVCNDIRSMLAAGPVCRLLKIPTLFFIRDTFEPQRRYGFKWRWAASLSDQLVCLSEEMKQQLERRLKTLRGKTPAVERLYSVVDFDRMHPVGPTERETLRRELGLGGKEFSVVCAAGVCAKKNQLALIEQLPALFDQTPQAHLHFVGDFDPQRDSYARRCEAAVNSGGLAERVTFHGYSTRIGDWYRAADCVLLASRREGLARCMIEALACGTPVVSFDVTSAHEILDRCGPQLVAPQGDYARLFAALGRLAEDPDARAKIGRTGAELARRRFSAEAATTQFAQLASRLTR